MSDQNDLAAKPGSHNRMSRRAFLISTSAVALAACAPATSTGGNPASSAAATAGKALKIGQLLPFTKVYAELGNSMKRSTDLYLKTKGNRLANRPVTVIYEDEANDPQVGLATRVGTRSRAPRTTARRRARARTSSAAPSARTRYPSPSGSTWRARRA